MYVKVFSFLFLLSVLTHSTMSETNPVTRGNAQFANKVFQQLAHKADGNVFFSPISIHTILSLIYQGARGKTRDALASSLNVLEQKQTADSYKEVMAALNSVANVSLDIANKIWVKQDYKLKNSFKALAVDNFFAEAEATNFNDPVGSAKTINTWVEQKTHDKIKDLIKPDFIDPLTAMVLVNAIYFKGDWLKPFPKDQTRKEKFHLSKTESVDVDMMHVEANFRYGVNQALNAQILELPYVNKDVTMLIVLPNEIDGIRELEQKLVDTDLTTLSQGLFSEKVQVSLPKFKIETTMDLKDTLTAAGLGIIFSDDADFRDLLDGDLPLVVSKAIQKAFIEVNEEGAEAAAATAFGIVAVSAALDPEIIQVFRADHPFLIVLQFRQKGANNIFFIGRVNKPTFF